MTTSTDTPTDDPAEAAAERVFGAILGAVDLLSMYLGDRLGYYRSLADEGPATATELAGRTGTDPRYTREWLEQQAVTSLLTVEQSRRSRLRAAGRDARGAHRRRPASTTWPRSRA